MQVHRFIVPFLALCLSSIPATALEEAPPVEGLRDLKQLNRQLVEMAPQAQQATVGLVSKGGHGSGSGVIVSEDGLVLTAAHVMAALSEEVVVILPDGTRLEAEKLGADFDRDAAMVRITEEAEFDHVELGDSEPLRRNDWCVATGHPGGFDPTRTPPFRLGRILRAGPFLETDCAVVGGDSGGPLFDVNGRVIGIHSNIGATLSQNRHVPISVFQEQWDEMLEGKRSGSRFAGGRPGADPDRAVMGVQLADRQGRGVAVSNVMEGSPAAKAGLKEGDVIIAIGKEKVSSRGQLIETVSSFEPGERIDVVTLRSGEREVFKVKLARLGDLMEREDAPEEAEDKGSEEGEVDEEGLEEYLDKMLENRKPGGGELRLELTPEQIEEFGGMEKLMDRLKEKLEERGMEMPDADGADEAEANDQEAEEDPEASEERQAQIKELLKRAMSNGGQLNLDPAEAEKLGGFDALRKAMAEMAESLDRKELLELAREAGMMEEDEFFSASMKALQQVVNRSGSATAEVTVDGTPVALGTFVNEEGWLLTKDTETLDSAVTVVWRGEEFDARLVERFPDYDLALYDVEGDGFESVRWAPPSKVKLGSLLATPDGNDRPIGIGMVSVLSRPLAEIGFLGISAEDGDETGVVIAQVVPESAAAKAGLEPGDRIVTLDGEKVQGMVDFSARIRDLRAGQTVELSIQREGKEVEIEAELGERPATPRGRRFQRMNEMGGKLSEKRGGFPAALQHDIPLEPERCGGPLLNLQGRCVGINVARAGRVKTFAIPSDAVQELLSSVDSDEVSEQEMDEVRALIREVRENLGELQERLELLEDR